MALSPANSRIAYTVFVFGVVPMAARFDEFSGVLATDTAQPQSCRVQVSVRVASLHMADATRTRMALGSTMLDAAHFPTMDFTGQCAGTTLTGALTLHGMTHPLVLSLSGDGGQVTATGMLQRRDYAIRGLAGLVGPRIRISLQTALPPARRAPP